MFMHTHTYMHTHTLTCMNAHYTHIYMHACTHAYTHLCTRNEHKPPSSTSIFTIFPTWLNIISSIYDTQGEDRVTYVHMDSCHDTNCLPVF